MSRTSQSHDPLDAEVRRLGPNCVSDLRFDRLALGELGEAERLTIARHVADCVSCSERRAALRADNERFLREVSIPTLAADALARAERGRRAHGVAALVQRWLLPASFCAFAGALVLMVSLSPKANRIKGGFALSPYVLHPEKSKVGALHAGEPLHPGDRLQFHYDSEIDGYLAVVSVDADKKVSVYAPAGARTEPITGGRSVALNGAVELDGTLGPETIVGVRCGSSIPVDEVVAAARQAIQPSGAVGPLNLPCAQTRYQIIKTPRPKR